MHGFQCSRVVSMEAKQCTRHHVVDRKQGTYASIFTAEPFFVFHQVNAFERDGKIYLDASCFHDNTIINQTSLGRFPFDKIFRFEIPGIPCDEWNSIFRFLGLTSFARKYEIKRRTLLPLFTCFLVARSTTLKLK